MRIFSLFAAVLQDKLKGGWLGELAESLQLPLEADTK